MSYSAIVVSWNARETLEPCLESIACQELDAPLETIVVDNASTDGTAELLRGYEGRIRLIRNTENLGFSIGNNQAAREASGQVLFFLNSDTVLLGRRALQELVERLSQPGVGLAGPRLLNPDGSLQPSCADHPSPLRALIEACGVHRVLPDAARARWALAHWSHTRERDVGWVMGAALAIDAKLFEELGGFWLEMYAEDEDLAWKVQRRGLSVRFVPSSQIVHVGNVSGRQRWSDQERAARVARAELEFLFRHYGRARTWLIRVITGFAYAWRALVLRAVGRAPRASVYAAMAREYARREGSAASR